LFALAQNPDHPEGGCRGVEYFNYLDSMTTNYARSKREITSRTVMTKATFNQKNPFSSKLEFQLKKKQANCYICNTALYGAEIGNFGKKF